MGNDCTKCVLHVGATNVCVSGIGKRSAPFLVVVQGPDSAEDVAGRIGSGRYTKMLIEMLQDAGYKGEDVRITSAVRCVSPGRAPEKDEIHACRDYLRDELLSCLPKVCVCVGEVPLQALCGTSVSPKERGTPLRLLTAYGLPELDVFYIRSLGMVLKTPTYRSVFVDELRRIRNSFLTPAEIPWKPWGEAPADLGEAVVYDIETNYDFETKTGGERLTQVNVACAAGVFIARGVEIALCLQRIAQVPRLIGHNSLTFDAPRSREIVPVFPDGPDTLALAWLLDETQMKSLDALAAKYCGAVSWKAGITAAEGSQELADYGARDAWYTLKLYERLAAELGPRVKIFDRIILPAFQALQECSKRGIYVSQAKVLEFTERFTREEAESLITLQEYVGDIAPWCRKKGGELAYKKPTPFNPGSPHQISEYFCHKNIMTRPTASGEGWSSDAKALETAFLPPGFREPLETYRHAKKMLGTYLEPLTKLGENGRIHPTYHLFPRVFGAGGTASGRLTATCNALTLPREMKNAGVYSAPPGKILAECDYGSLEFRLAAWFSGATAVLENYKKDPTWDPHSWFARAFYGLGPDDPVTKEMRQVAKSANFSQAYGGFWGTMQNYGAGLGISLSQETCEKAHATFHALMPEIRPWWASVSAYVKQHGYIETPTGRRRNFGPWGRIPHDMRGDIEREAVNMLPQSFGHDLTLLSLANAHQKGMEVVLEWHDSLWIELSADVDKKKFENEMQGIMLMRPIETLSKDFGVTLDVPLIIEVKYFKDE